MEDPQAEAVLPPVVNVLLDLFPGRLFRKGLAVCGERLHDLGIGEQAVEIMEVQGRDGLGKEASGGQGGDGVGHDGLTPLLRCNAAAAFSRTGAIVIPFRCSTARR